MLSSTIGQLCKVLADCFCKLLDGRWIITILKHKNVGSEIESDSEITLQWMPATFLVVEWREISHEILVSEFNMQNVHCLCSLKRCPGVQWRLSTPGESNLSSLPQQLGMATCGPLSKKGLPSPHCHGQSFQTMMARQCWGNYFYRAFYMNPSTKVAFSTRTYRSDSYRTFSTNQ